MSTRRLTAPTHIFRKQKAPLHSLMLEERLLYQDRNVLTSNGGYEAIWLQGYVATRPVATRLRGYVAMLLRCYVATWL